MTETQSISEHIITEQADAVLSDAAIEALARLLIDAEQFDFIHPHESEKATAQAWALNDYQNKTITKKETEL